MKIEQQKQEFRPVVITLETSDEHSQMVNMCYTVIEYSRSGVPAAEMSKGLAEKIFNHLQGKTTTT